MLTQNVAGLSEAYCAAVCGILLNVPRPKLYPLKITNSPTL